MFTDLGPSFLFLSEQSVQVCSYVCSAVFKPHPGAERIRADGEQDGVDGRVDGQNYYSQPGVRLKNITSMYLLIFYNFDDGDSDGDGETGIGRDQPAVPKYCPPDSRLPAQ